jgi:hypothetical protein
MARITGSTFLRTHRGVSSVLHRFQAVPPQRHVQTGPRSCILLRPNPPGPTATNGFRQTRRRARARYCASTIRSNPSSPNNGGRAKSNWSNRPTQTYNQNCQEEFMLLRSLFLPAFAGSALLGFSAPASTQGNLTAAEVQSIADGSLRLWIPDDHELRCDA